MRININQEQGIKAINNLLLLTGTQTKKERIKEDYAKKQEEIINNIFNIDIKGVIKLRK
jgi:hypothetical protein